MKSFDRQPPKIAFERLQAKPNALLIDCRTKAEWAYVGVPILPGNPQKTNFIEWVDTAGQPNPDFLSEVRNISSTDTPLYLICRSGVRSAAACQLLAESGFTALVNIEDGFEGEVGIGVSDVHVNEIESPELIRDRILYAAKALGDPTKIYVNPDCGLRTRTREVSFDKIRSMVKGAELARKAVE